MAALDVVGDPVLRYMIQNSRDKPWMIVEEGQGVLEDSADPVAVLEVMRRCIALILADLGEHGDGNAYLYGYHKQAWFKALDKKLATQLKGLVAAGRTSAVFSEWSAADKAERDSAFAAREQERDRNEATGRAVLSALELQHKTDAAACAATLRTAAAKITSSADGFADAIPAYVNNALLHWHSVGDGGAVDALIEAWLDVVARLHPVGDAAVAASSNALALATIHRDTARVRACLDTLAPARVADVRLAYNAACAYAFLGDRPGLMTMARQARALGRPAASFGSDFDSYRDDPEFMVAIAGA